MSFRTAPRCLFKHRFSFWLLPFCRSIFLLRNPPWRHDCISSHMSFLWARNRHNRWAVRLCQFCRGKTGEQLAAEAFRGSSRHPAASPPPAALGWTAELQAGLTLWLIKDLPVESAVVPLTFKAASSRGFEGGQEVDKRLFRALPIDSVGRLSTERMQYHL